MALSLELSKRCREVLLKCSEFDSHRSLKSVLATTELSFLKNRLPECSTKIERVSQTLDFLLLKHSIDGRPALPLLLAALRDRYHGSLRNELEQIRSEVDQILTGKVVVPFVVVAMRKSEAIELVEEAIFQDNPNVSPAEYTLFQQFKQALEEHGVNKIIDHYGEKRESWKPLACPDTTISGIIADVLDHANRHHREPRNLSPLLPYFISDDFIQHVESEGRKPSALWHK